VNTGNFSVIFNQKEPSTNLPFSGLNKSKRPWVWATRSGVAVKPCIIKLRIGKKTPMLTHFRTWFCTNHVTRSHKKQKIPDFSSAKIIIFTCLVVGSLLFDRYAGCLWAVLHDIIKLERKIVKNKTRELKRRIKLILSFLLQNYQHTQNDTFVADSAVVIFLQIVSYISCIL